MIYVVNIMTNQGGSEAFSYLSFRIMTGIWVLCATVLVNSYTGIVILSLTKPRMKPTINSFEDLAASKEVLIVFRHDTAMGEQILKATSGVYEILGDQARSNPDHIVGDPFKLNALLETGRYAYPFFSTFSYSFVGSQYRKEKKCRFKTSKTLSASTGSYSFLFKKGSSHTSVMSRAYVILEITTQCFKR
ncbi:glutamate receptor ionotropic, kainate glr-3-like isoform X1 [Daphnia carinata]|uniref:glutamate receptor ionotropic, kainate glr-3-like isoform X1 n=1 Tax=Daphnia carinata TaxID=120202 RepID=UPI00257C9D76|nr:glutamate receptor ionotropic, kainate glr-3-like isoform X1 [Daphnia carinata]XP_057381703.1 glutamate receptor ionotropic, kainate glr-3-like isoform X1 [Daphnia carinata]XP_059352419.1 glutamate receptor ionotropic, kainate glr-3-like isoform X1 [Daphnia carinata]